MANHASVDTRPAFHPRSNIFPSWQWALATLLIAGASATGVQLYANYQQENSYKHPATILHLTDSDARVIIADSPRWRLKDLRVGDAFRDEKSGEMNAILRVEGNNITILNNSSNDVRLTCTETPQRIQCSPAR